MAPYRTCLVPVTVGPATVQAPPPPLGRPCQLELAPLGSALSPLRWRVNLGASHGEGVYKRKHRPWWPALPCRSSQRTDRRPDGTSPNLKHDSRRSGGAAALPLPPCTSVGGPAVLLSHLLLPCTSVGGPTVPLPSQLPPPMSWPRTHGMMPPDTRNTLDNTRPHPQNSVHNRRHP